MNREHPILAACAIALLWLLLGAIVLVLASCEPREEPEVPADPVLAELDAITEQLRQIRRELELVEADCVAPEVTEQPTDYTPAADRRSRHWGRAAMRKRTGKARPRHDGCGHDYTGRRA